MLSNYTIDDVGAKSAITRTSGNEKMWLQKLTQVDSMKLQVPSRVTVSLKNYVQGELQKSFSHMPTSKSKAT
jgi:hypothetical protein